ncbi:MAG: hypothetical protein ACKOBA_10565, partial [Limnohabitans sp.]
SVAEICLPFQQLRSDKGSGTPHTAHPTGPDAPGPHGGQLISPGKPYTGVVIDATPRLPMLPGAFALSMNSSPYGMQPQTAPVIR